ncbi:hypothetical protein GB931_15405 [Modestobacter sp. I12A-02628]|uniref:GPP34 family phosphoprotein n=1 Tax=Goekera deserti TaxID=2497753 RepID=A0A7K3WL67_9ACTN|nr:hypothetical protein [Goekera deserti]MPQ99279.1 hypothetical protein [Goekera deserti]NDI50278.1 hypothetical protein [Goekera deserti]NEL56470.1 hypothetical protein [Goekera deserti]
MTASLAELVTTRLAALCLGRRGRPRGLTFDDHLVRGGLVVDLALGGALRQTDDAVEMDHDRAAALGLAAVAAEADEGDGSLLDWLDAGRLGFADWSSHLVAAGVWRQHSWSLRWAARGFEDLQHRRVASDRALGSAPPGPHPPATSGVLALGRVAGLLGHLGEAPAPALDGLGDARWAGELVAERLVELRVTMRAIGHAVD